MAQANLKDLKARIKKAEKIKEDRRALDQGAYELAMPQRNLYTETTQGDSRMTKVFSSLGMASVNSFVNNIQSSLTPAFTRWAEAKAGAGLGEEVREQLNESLEDVNEQFFNFLNASNFNTESTAMYYDLAVGTGALLFNKGTYEKPFNFTAVPTAQLALEIGVNGSIGGVFRKHKIQGRLIEFTWTDAEIPDKLARQIKEKPSDEVTLDEVTYLDMETDTWYYEILWLDDDTKEGSRLVERTTSYNIWVIPRWSVVAGEVYGRGPLLQALPDLKMLNNGKQMAAMSAQMNAFGSYTVEEEGIINPETAEINPGGILVVKNNPGGPAAPSIAALPRTGDSRDQQIFFENLESDIKKILLDNKLPPEAGAVRSATEIVERIKEFQVDFGASFGRLMHEYITPLYKTGLTILDELGRIKLPVITIKDPVTGLETKKKITEDAAFASIQMLSPIAKQQALEDVQNVMQAVQLSQQIEPRLPLLGFKVEDIPAWLGDKLGMPEELKRSEGERVNAMATLGQLLGGQQ